MPDKTRIVGNLVSDNNLFSNPTTDNMGIGTTNPSSKIHVVGNGLFTGIVTALSFSGNASSATYATSSGISTYSTSAGIATYAISSGIATYSITSGVSTSVIGGIGSITSLSVSGVITTTTLQVGVGGTIINTSGSNIGIGTTNPTSKLHVVGDGLFIGVVTATTVIGNLTGTATTATNVVGGIGSLNFLSVSGISTTLILNVGLGGSIITTNSSGNIGFRTTNPIQPFQIGTGSSIVVIDNMGELGIGTTNPSVKLDVIGDVKVSGIITATNFVGSGKDLTDITSGIFIRKDSNNVGSSVSTINFTGSGISTITVASGIATVNIQGIQTSVNTYTTSSLASNASENFTLTTPSIFQLLSFTASTPSWIRVYGTSSARSADSRTSPGGTPPLPGTEFYAELVTTTSPQTIRLSPVPVVQSTNKQTFLSVKNMDNVSRTITMEFTGLTLQE